MSDAYQRHLQTTMVVGAFMGVIVGAWATYLASVMTISFVAAIVIAVVTMLTPSYKDVVADAE